MNICMYACMYVLYAYIHVCMHICVYACMHICMHVCIHVCLCVIFKLGFERYGGNCPGGIVRGKCPFPESTSRHALGNFFTYSCQYDVVRRPARLSCS